MSGRIVEVRIDELVLAGFAPLDRARVAEVASRELERLLAEGGRWKGGALVVAEVVAADLSIPPGAAPEAVGLQLARVVHGELSS